MPNKETSLQWRHNGNDSVSNHRPYDCLLNRLFRRRSKKTSKLRVTGLCAGNSPETGEFPAQMASYAENASIWWRHHVMLCFEETLRCIYTIGKIWNIWKAQREHSYLTCWFARNGFAPATNKYCDFNVNFMCRVMVEKCNLQCPKWRIHNRMYRNVTVIILRLHFSHNNFSPVHCESMGICVCTIISYLPHAKFAIGHWITIWNQMAERCDSWCSILPFGILAKICSFVYINRADSRFSPSQWDTALHCNGVSHWLSASLESAPI